MRTLLILSALILFSFTVNAQERVKPAKEILDSAYKQAKEQHKKVMVIFTASWCGWCKKMDASINNQKCKKIF